jgi:hypothetical protein
MYMYVLRSLETCKPTARASTPFLFCLFRNTPHVSHAVTTVRHLAVRPLTAQTLPAMFLLYPLTAQTPPATIYRN